MKSLIKWIGGQRLLAKTIIELLPHHRCYVEAFGGAGWVLFAKEPSPAEVYNDLDGRLVGLFRSVKHHPEEFVRQLEFSLPSREMFDLFKAQPGLTELQRAARFYFVLKMSFGGKCGSFGPRKRESTRFLLEKLVTDVERVRERLQRVVIEHLDFTDVLRRYDAADTAFFLSPPYMHSHQYTVPFHKTDHERLRRALDALKAKWLLLYNDHPLVRRTYSSFLAYKVTANYTLQRGKPKARDQLIIMNYRPSRSQLKASPRPLTLLTRRRSSGK